MHASVDLHIAATPQRVWELVSDITKMGEYSPEVFEAEWLDGATGPAVGARYRGHVKRNEVGPIYWTTCRVTDCVPGEVFAFEVLAGGQVVNTWRYDFAPGAGAGCDVTESFRMPDNLATRAFGLVAGRLRTNRNRRDMLRTLERVKAVAEA